jgi:hypothetical protein
MRFFTHAKTPEPQPGDTIISYTPPREESAEDLAARRKARKGKPAESDKETERDTP